MVRSRGRTDTNQKDIVDKCRARDWVVVILSQYKGHPFDILVGAYRMWISFEVKRSEKEKLTEREAVFAVDCYKHQLPHYAVCSFEQIEQVFEIEK